MNEFPATSQQVGVYIDYIRNKKKLNYNNIYYYKLKKTIDIEKIKEAFLKLFDKQELFKCKFYEKEINGNVEIYGYIDSDCKLVFENYTLENIHQFVRPFDLHKAPLIRVGLIEKEKILLTDIHHIITDAFTPGIIKKELNNYYYNGEIKELEIQFSDYAIYLNEGFNKGYFDKEISFYEEMFKKDYDILNIPTKEEISTNDNHNDDNGVCIRIIDKKLSSTINNYMKYHDISKTSFFLSIYGYVLSKYSGQDTVYSSI
eukprot:jgi/Orpsp1_1/1188508/evm.model.d7180000065385.1